MVTYLSRHTEIGSPSLTLSCGALLSDWNEAHGNRFVFHYTPDPWLVAQPGGAVVQYPQSKAAALRHLRLSERNGRDHLGAHATSRSTHP